MVTGQEEICRKLREEVHGQQVKMEQLRMEKAKLAARIKTIDGHRQMSRMSCNLENVQG